MDIGQDHTMIEYAWSQRPDVRGLVAVCKPLLSGKNTTKGEAAIMMDEVGRFMTLSSVGAS